MGKIFFGCSMRGGYSQVSKEDLIKIRKIIQELGYNLISEHQTQNNIIEKENQLSREEIHDRDYEWLKQADVGIFEVSNPSLGVGGEIADMVHLKKPVLCLFKKGLENSVSAYILGKKNSSYISIPFEYYAYEGAEEVKDVVKKFMEKVKK
jgi:nucleoside 2-deoxyribosyltransferase